MIEGGRGREEDGEEEAGGREGGQRKGERGGREGGKETGEKGREGERGADKATSMSTLALWRLTMLQLPRSPSIENLTAFLGAEMVIVSPTVAAASGGGAPDASKGLSSTRYASSVSLCARPCSRGSAALGVRA